MEANALLVNTVLKEPLFQSIACQVTSVQLMDSETLLREPWLIQMSIYAQKDSSVQEV
jgi:hypothetical protein